MSTRDRVNTTERCPACDHGLHFGHAFGGVAVFSCPGCKRRWEKKWEPILGDRWYQQGHANPWPGKGRTQVWMEEGDVAAIPMARGGTKLVLSHRGLLRLAERLKKKGG